MAWTRFTKKKDMPGGLWIKCESCGTMLFRKEFESRHRVCASCGYHFTLPGRERIRLTADEGSFEEIDMDLLAEDRLGFVDRMPYAEKLVKTRKKTGEPDAAIAGTCTIHGHRCVVGVMNFAFMGGSMGMVVGEKFARAIEKAIELKVPVVLFACSGGARMHEGAISLMQMAKTCAALSRLNEAGVLSISVMTHPTTGGVTASFASVCDLLIAEPGALIGFAGPRVIATTIKKELPKGFQRAEFLLAKGQLDTIVARSEMRFELARMIGYATGEPFRLDGDDSQAEEPTAAADDAKATAAAKKTPKKKGRSRKEKARPSRG
jgi:acetyl-CoA carboxylase carboxyl transferase subunit beta